MLDILALLGLIGYSAKDIPSALRQVKSTWKGRSLKDYQESIETFADEGAVCRVLQEYYQTSRPSYLRRYRVSLNGIIRETSQYTTDSWVATATHLSDIAYKLGAAPTPYIPEAVRAYAPSVIQRLNETSIETWDNSTFRLTKAPTAERIRSLDFSLTSFLSYRFTVGLLEDEVKESLVKFRGDVDQIVRNREKSLPVREALLPDIGSIADLTNRLCVGGPVVVFAMARDAPHNDFVILLQVRSAKVTDSPGRLSTLPQGFHTSELNHPESEVDLTWTVLRELYEEVFGGQEVSRASQRLAHDWYMESNPFMKYFLEHQGAFRSDLVGFGLNGRTGSYECAVLLSVLDTWYWRTYRSVMLPLSWETDKCIQLSSKDKAQITEVLSDGNWASESLFAISQGLIQLKEIDPRRVDLPDLRFDLV